MIELPRHGSELALTEPLKKARAVVAAGQRPKQLLAMGEAATVPEDVFAVRHGTPAPVRGHVDHVVYA